MKGLSRRMKRLLAILVVECVVAVNVLSTYANEAGSNYTISEEQLAKEEANNAGGQNSGNETQAPNNVHRQKVKARRMGTMFLQVSLSRKAANRQFRLQILL